MKKVFWILMLANVVLFAAMQRGWFGWGEPMPQAQPALHEDMIRLLDAQPSAPVANAPIPNAPTASVPMPGTPVAASAVPPPPLVAASHSPAVAAAPAPAAVKTYPQVCLEWGEFTGADLTRATAALSDLQLGDKLSQHQIERDTGYWVYIPPLKNKAAVNRKIGQLKARGVTEYFVVQNEGQWQNAISLGVFKTQEAARLFLADLETKKVRSAVVGQRNSKFKVTVFRLHGVGILTEVKVAALQKEYPGSELQTVACALTR